MLNKSKGNMYPWVSHTWNVIKGKCPHDCSYCYMKKYPQSELHFDEQELKTDLGSGNFIFVGSSCDMWAIGIPTMWINDVIEHCSEFDNRYLFQSKNPERFLDAPFFNDQFRLMNIVLGATIETNRIYPHYMGLAPSTYYRMNAMANIIGDKMVSIEPIMDFDLDVMLRWMLEIKPQFVSIGANTNFKVKLPEPEPYKVEGLIAGLKEFTEVKTKLNLRRLLGNNA